ncbi:MAG: DoxX family protein [Flavobacteriaceae bacterium]|jgi:hypothetical protein|nr:DoxX family protein [Flavobacteriaceae bacterium]
MDYFLTIVLFTSISFVAYGINSFISKRMKKEFKRWGLENKQKTIACCQLVGGAGLFFGLEWNSILILSSSFLGVMMLVAIGVRIKVKDDISDILPAFAYLVLSAMILYEATG